jgi:glutathione S-transferase
MARRMSGLTLVIANKNYSSWSLRAWLFLRHTGVSFREIRVGLDEPDTRARIAQYSPSGRVPVLVDGDLTVWDSLAICEYLNERVPEVHGWPADREARAVARSVSAEMHSGFQALRNELPMNCRARRRVTPSAAALADIERVRSIWESCRSRYGAGGPWLFGPFSIADTMYAPVVLRFRTYAVELDGSAAAYAHTVLSDAAMNEWLAAALAETEIVPSDEAGTPV